MTDRRERRDAPAWLEANWQALSNVTELHPEELFDKQDAGELSQTEAAELSHHLERCAACRVERAARAEFRTQLAQDAGPLDLILGGALGALSGSAARPHAACPPGPGPEPAGPHAALVAPGAAAGAELDAGSSEALLRLAPHGIESTLDGVCENALPSVTKRPTDRRVSSAALVATALLFAGAAAAWQLGLGVAQDPPAQQATLGSAPQATATSGHRGSGATASPPEDPIPAAAVPTKSSQGASTRNHAATSPLPAATTRAPRSAATPRSAAPQASDDTASAAQLFATANRERVAGKPGQAQQHYAELVRRFPKSPEARAARALSAQLALDTGSPDRALAEYDRYLSSADAAPLLTEEALVGRARALSRMQDRAAERAAWLELLRRFPSTPARKEAAQRLASTSGR